MDGAGGDHMHPVPAASAAVAGTSVVQRHKMMMHMTFFWGTDSEILFHSWPGSDPRMYALALILVFFLSVLVEWLSNSRPIRGGWNREVSGWLQTLMHAIRVGSAYVLMLAVMSFNVGVFLVAVAGHAVGFLLFRSRVFQGGDSTGGESTVGSSSGELLVGKETLV